MISTDLGSERDAGMESRERGEGGGRAGVGWGGGGPGGGEGAPGGGGGGGQLCPMQPPSSDGSVVR